MGIHLLPNVVGSINFKVGISEKQSGDRLLSMYRVMMGLSNQFSYIILALMTKYDLVCDKTIYKYLLTLNKYNDIAYTID